MYDFTKVYFLMRGHCDYHARRLSRCTSEDDLIFCNPADRLRHYSTTRKDPLLQDIIEKFSQCLLNTAVKGKRQRHLCNEQCRDTSTADIQLLHMY